MLGRAFVPNLAVNLMQRQLPVCARNTGLRRCNRCGYTTALQNSYFWGFWPVARMLSATCMISQRFLSRPNLLNG